MAAEKIKINRAPVMTLWAAVVAERLGYPRDTALTLGKAVAGLNAQSKGRRLGIYGAKSEEEKARAREKQPSVEEYVEIMGRGIPAIRTPQGLRAAIEGEAIHPESVETYLRQKFKDDLDAVRDAMRALAETYAPDELEEQAYDLYEQFRPEIPEGTTGWGAKGELDLDYIRSLGK